MNKTNYLNVFNQIKALYEFILLWNVKILKHLNFTQPDIY